MMRNRKTHATLATCILLFVKVVSLPAAEAENLDAARKAWQARQVEVKTASFTFVKTRFIPVGSALMPGHGRIAMGGRASKSDKKPEGPETEVKYDVTTVIKIDAEKTRAFYDAPPILLGGRLALDERTTQLTTFDGTVGMSMTTHTAEELYPKGRIFAEAESLARTTLYLPLVWHYRASQTDLLSLPGDGLINTGDTGVSAGRRCQIFQEKGGRRQQFWSDPERNYCIARYRWLLSGGTPHTTIDIEYTDDPAQGPVPTQWTVREFDSDGSLMQQEDAKVTSYEINKEIPADEFRIAFPVGTYVSDQRTRERYIVREDGQKRPVTPAERKGGATYKQLLNSEPGEGLTRRGSTLRFTLIFLTVFVIIILIGLSLRQRRTTV